MRINRLNLRKVVAIVICLTGVIMFVSCKKEKKICWDCVKTVEVTVTGVAAVVTNESLEICDKTEAEIRQEELKANNVVTTGIGITTKTATSMRCIKKD
jgi:uncharacterized membrane protein